MSQWAKIFCLTQRRNVKAQVVGDMAGQVDSDGPDLKKGGH